MRPDTKIAAYPIWFFFIEHETRGNRMVRTIRNKIGHFQKKGLYLRRKHLNKDGVVYQI